MSIAMQRYCTFCGGELNTGMSCIRCKNQPTNQMINPSDKLPEFGDSNDWNIWLNGFATLDQFKAEFAARELGRLLISHGYDTPEKVLAAIENDKAVKYLGGRKGMVMFGNGDLDSQLSFIVTVTDEPIATANANTLPAAVDNLPMDNKTSQDYEYTDADDAVEYDIERKSRCTCGAYQWSQSRGDFVTVADCCCGAY